MTSQVDVNDTQAPPTPPTPPTPGDCYSGYPVALAQVAREEEGRMVHLLTIASAGYEEVPVVVDFRRAATALLDTIADSGEDDTFTGDFLRTRLRTAAEGMARNAELRLYAERMRADQLWRSALTAHRRQRRQSGLPTTRDEEAH